jgi:AAA domain
VAEAYVGQGYVRLNRDERGGSLRELAEALDEALAAGTRQVVLDNTYLTRASRSYVVEAAGRHRTPVRCLWLDTPLAQAQVNLVERLLDRLGALPGPAELKTLSREPGMLAPTSQMRALRELEPPSGDEGFAAVEQLPFVRPPSSGRAGVFVAAAAWEAALEHGDPSAPHLVFDWSADGAADALAAAAARVSAAVSGPVEAALCPHGGGPPTCWCRPPLPGLPLAFARSHGVDPARSLLVGVSPAHRTLATALGARCVLV